MASGTYVHEITRITCSPNVYSEGKNICRLSDKLFINNKNAICCAGGEYEVPASIKDPVMRELCKVICETREEWLKCKRSGSKKCPCPTGKAAKRVNDKLKNSKSGLRNALGKRIGSAEKPFFTSKSGIFDGVRKAYTKEGMQPALKRQVDRLVRNKVIQRGKKIVAKSWMKLVPGLNVISAIVDAIGTSMDVDDVGKMIYNSSTFFDNANSDLDCFLPLGASSQHVPGEAELFIQAGALIIDLLAIELHRLVDCIGALTNGRLDQTTISSLEDHLPLF